MTGPLERRCIENALDQLPRLPGDCFISINVSPMLIIEGGLRELLEAFPTERLVIEITEHAVVHDYAAVTRELQPLRARGARLAVDDAGAGYASFRHILDLGPDIVKLDMSLTRHVDTDLRRQALAAGMTEFAAKGGFELVAEGVETEGELVMLQSFGQRLGQGFFFSRPHVADNLAT
jgi:EAL domain-containing protein (putative c-di-GMP-specific phosphodiesterase class I)